MVSPVLKPLSGDGARRLKEFLASCGYTHETFRDTPALRELPSGTGASELAMAHTAEPSTLNVLVRFFFLGMSQEADVAEQFVPATITEMLLESGVLARDGSLFVPTVMLTPCDDYLFAADTWMRMVETPQNVVVWPNPSTRVLQQFALRTPTGSTLDLGTGCGILAVAAAGYSACVVATDLNPRAGDFVALNAALNGVSNIEYRLGDAFEPLRGCMFDRILSNPPFFISPNSGQMYCENDMELDQFCRRIVRESAAHLNEGGFFQATVEWVQIHGQKWQERIAEWVEALGCDAWISRTYGRDIAGYAHARVHQTWLADQRPGKFAEWLAYYRDRGVEEIHGGLLAMRRRSGRNWVRIEEMPANPSGPFGGDLPAIFDTQDILAAHPTDPELMEMKPRLAPHVQLEQKYQPGEAGWSTASLRLQLHGGIPGAMAVERQVADFAAQCDGVKTLGELSQDLSSRIKVPLDLVRQQCCAVVRKLADGRFIYISR